MISKKGEMKIFTLINMANNERVANSQNVK